MARLAALAVANGSTLSRLSEQLDLDSDFLDRVDAGRQALPDHTADRIAAAFGIPAVEVRICVSQTTHLAEMPSRLRPLPSLPGEPVHSKPRAPTVEPPLPLPPLPP